LNEEPGWRDPRFERGQVDEQLERGAGLARRLRRTVVDRRHIVLAADHRADSAIAVHGHQRTLGAVGGIRLDRLVGGDLHCGIERGPYVDRIGALVDQGLELWQRPVGEVADAVLLGRLLDADLGRVCRRSDGVTYEAVAGHRLQDHRGA